METEPIRTNEKGAALVEAALLVVLLIVVVIPALTSTGNSVSNSLCDGSMRLGQVSQVNQNWAGYYDPEQGKCCIQTGEAFGEPTFFCDG